MSPQRTNGCSSFLPLQYTLFTPLKNPFKAALKKLFLLLTLTQFRWSTMFVSSVAATSCHTIIHYYESSTPSGHRTPQISRSSLQWPLCVLSFMDSWSEYSFKVKVSEFHIQTNQPAPAREEFGCVPPSDKEPLSPRCWSSHVTSTARHANTHTAQIYTRAHTHTQTVWTSKLLGT